MASGSLQVFFSEHLHILLKVDLIRVDSCLVIFNLLVHQAQVQIDRCDFGVVVSSYKTQNHQCSMHIRETHAEVTTVVVVHGES